VQPLELKTTVGVGEEPIYRAFRLPCSNTLWTEVGFAGVCTPASVPMAKKEKAGNARLAAPISVDNSSSRPIISRDLVPGISETWPKSMIPWSGKISVASLVSQLGTHRDDGGRGSCLGGRPKNTEVV
jgi:hypothetical protein